MGVYDVALWQKWPPPAFPLVDCIDAADGIEAVEKMMNVHHVEYMSRVAVKLEGDSFVTRYDHVMLVEGVLEGNAVVDAIQVEKG
jgi:hypothetical protein